MKMETAQALIDRANEHFRKDWLAAGRLGFAALVPLFVGSCTRDCGAQATGRVIEGIGCALLFCALLGAWWSIRAFRNVMRDMRSYRTTLYTDDQGESRAYIRGADEHDLGGAFAAFFALVRTVEIRRLRARMEHYKRACITTSNEVTRVLGEALYGPNPDAWSTHTPEAIADEAAEEIGRLRAENDRLRAQIAIEVGTRDNALSEYRVAYRRALWMVAIGCEWCCYQSQCTEHSLADVWYGWLRDKALRSLASLGDSDAQRVIGGGS